jgi:chromosomal replication initiator protein
MLKHNLPLLLAEIKRLQRLHPHDALPGVLTNYISERYYPKTMATSRSGKRKNGPTFETIRDKILNHYNADWDRLVSPSRKREVVAIRRIFMYVLALRTKLTITAIGEHFNRDHTTVIHNRDRLMELMEGDADLRLDVEFLNSKI